MTERLYYTDSYLTEFSGTLLQQRRLEKGFGVVLDRTLFYPTSGGQPHDTGWLQNARVLDVFEEDAGAILHVLDREIGTGHVSGKIDWSRRFDHMQQHTGQHILSQAFLAVAQARTLSFHMGSETSTIDVDLDLPTPAQMEEARRLAAKVVFDDRAVRILTTDRDTIGSLGVRKESRREGEIRVIDIEGFDRTPCGGTHVGRTGEVGMIFVLGLERYKGGTRIEFVAGHRALKTFYRDHALLKRLGSLHSAAPENLPAMTEKLLQERMTLSREIECLQNRLLEMEAADLLQKAVKTEYASVVRKTYVGRSLETIKALAQKLTAHPGVLALLGTADTCQLVAARSPNLQGNCGDAIKQAAAELGGKGGGRPEFAQAGGFSADSLDSWLRAVEKYFL